MFEKQLERIGDKLEKISQDYKDSRAWKEYERRHPEEAREELEREARGVTRKKAEEEKKKLEERLMRRQRKED